MAETSSPWNILPIIAMEKWLVSVDSRSKESNGLAAARQYEQALVDGDGLRF